MNFRKFVRSVLSVALCVGLMPALAAAQGTIAGAVTDTSGAVLPGVTVEAASSVLIEKARTVVSDDQGRYSIVDLRPGVYTVTFTLAGFRMAKRDGVELSSSIVIPINAQMEVGSLEESVTVSGATPVVDVQSTQRTQQLSREALTALPGGRTTWGVGQLVQGVKMSVGDVGGSRQTEQSYMTVRGIPIRNTTTQVDGILVNSLNQDGAVNVYYDDAMVQELTYQVSGVPAEVSAGGIRLNIIPKDGGNTVRGEIISAVASGKWQSDNVTPALIARGLSLGPRIKHVLNIDGSLGGPLIKDKLWILFAERYQETPVIAPNITYPDGSRVTVGAWIVTSVLRPTWQITPKNKLSAFVNHNFRDANHEVTAGELNDPVNTLRRRWHPIWYAATVKWTAPLTNRLLVEAGIANVPQHFTSRYQNEDVRKAAFTPEWYANASRLDRNLLTRRTASDNETGTFAYRSTSTASVSYVSGSHNIKTGVQVSIGRNRSTGENNAHLTQEYLSGVPASVTVRNNPVDARTRMHDVGIYLQDSWVMRRLTVSPGIRYDQIVESFPRQVAPAGRFVPARDFAAQSNFPNWKTVSPRVGGAFDLFGNAKTALKFNYGIWQQAEGISFSNTYNPMFGGVGLGTGGIMAGGTERRTWRDLNNDDIAQDNEIGPSAVGGVFGLLPPARPSPDYRRTYNVQATAGIQHELIRGVAVSGSWYRRTDYNLPIRVNLARTLADWTPVTVRNPISGELITAYNLNAAKFGLVDFEDTTSTDFDTRRNSSIGFEIGANARLPRGIFAFGGWNHERTVNVACSSPDDPNTLRFCDESKLDMPFSNEFKVAGNVPLWYGFEVSEVFQSYQGALLGAVWNVTPATRNADGTLVIPSMTNPSLAIQLITPGTKYLPRVNQLDLSFKRVFRSGDKQIEARMDIFNVMNTSVETSQNQSFGAALGRPLVIYNPRIVRFGTQIRF